MVRRSGPADHPEPLRVALRFARGTRTFLNMAPIVMIMGVSGSGKTTIGALLAGQLGWQYAEADDFHPPENVAKMAAGHPLDDEDRWPWLEAIGRWNDARRAAG